MRSAFQLVFNSWKIRRTELPTEFVGTLDRSEIIKTNVSSFISRDAPHHVDFQIPIDPPSARSPFVVLYDVILRRMKTITRSNNNESFKKASATVHVNIPIQIETLLPPSVAVDQNTSTHTFGGLTIVPSRPICRPRLFWRWQLTSMVCRRWW